MLCRCEVLLSKHYLKPTAVCLMHETLKTIHACLMVNVYNVSFCEFFVPFLLIVCHCALTPDYNDTTGFATEPYFNWR